MTHVAPMGGPQPEPHTQVSTSSFWLLVVEILLHGNLHERRACILCDHGKIRPPGAAASDCMSSAIRCGAAPCHGIDAPNCFTHPLLPLAPGHQLQGTVVCNCAGQGASDCISSCFMKGRRPLVLCCCSCASCMCGTWGLSSTVHLQRLIDLHLAFAAHHAAGVAEAVRAQPGWPSDPARAAHGRHPGSFSILPRLPRTSQ